MVFSGSSMVRLKCGDRNGRQPSIVVRRYALNAFVKSFSGDAKQEAKEKIEQGD